MEDHALRKRATPEQTDVWLRNYNLQEIWEGTQPQLTDEEKKKIKLKIP